MLIIASDLHLGDGTTANSIAPGAFHLFSNRLRETAYYASFRKDGTYRPVEELDLVLLGDILDPLHSTLWLDTGPSDKNYIRPWSDRNSPFFAAKLAQTTQAIITENKESLEILRRCANGETILLPPADSHGKPDSDSKEKVATRVRVHYLVGNHDWYYHLKGAAFDEIRKTIIQALGLAGSNSLKRFVDTYACF